MLKDVVSNRSTLPAGFTGCILTPGRGLGISRGKFTRSDHRQQGRLCATLTIKGTALKSPEAGLLDQVMISKMKPFRPSHQTTSRTKLLEDPWIQMKWWQRSDNVSKTHGSNANKSLDQSLQRPIEVESNTWSTKVYMAGPNITAVDVHFTTVSSGRELQGLDLSLLSFFRVVVHTPSFRCFLWLRFKVWWCAAIITM